MECLTAAKVNVHFICILVEQEVMVMEMLLFSFCLSEDWSKSKC